jgi:hypothetical protein
MPIRDGKAAHATLRSRTMHIIKRKRSFYCAYNYQPDFLNTWCIARFDSKADRATFIDQIEADSSAFRPYKAIAVSRARANEIWRGTYLSAGNAIPKGGLFAVDRYNNESHFSNENRYWRK